MFEPVFLGPQRRRRSWIGKDKKEFIKHPKPQDSSTGGEIVKFEADDWDRLLMSGEESESKKNLMTQND
ncbi:hypothetical protein Bca52824_050459 [Brassica carinata]|uniref:Uncharacterized protein n=1 Tax=Brassica carinata TaxID=52824 RepID=A0A8X7UI05_BRACI|nr:hypothetical protein Bca52824_050459 [Brassica carinata]